MQPALLREAATLAEQGVACALAVVVDAKGSVPGKPGATMLVTVDGTARGTVGGAGLEERVKALAVEAIRRGEGGVHTLGEMTCPKCGQAVTANEVSGGGGVHEFDLARWKQGGLDSVCGGTVRVAIHVLRAAPHVLLLGGGHCAEALARILDVLDWSYTVVDSRPQYADAERFPRARATATMPGARFVRAQDELPYTHAYVLGHSHHEDGESVIALLQRGFPGVVGVIGSQSKIHAFRERAKAAGVEWRDVRCPIGLDVGADTPAEIAVAVAGEIIRDIKNRSVGPGREPDRKASELSP